MSSFLIDIENGAGGDLLKVDFNKNQPADNDRLVWDAANRLEELIGQKLLRWIT
jgi:hypothetical protein